jgi:hypothetical protein
VTLAISPDGRTLYACESDGLTGTLAAYSTATGAQTRVLHQWPVKGSGGGAPGTNSGYMSRGFSCQISTDPTGRYLLAAVNFDVHFDTITARWRLPDSTSRPAPSLRSRSARSTSPTSAANSPGDGQCYAFLRATEGEA